MSRPGRCERCYHEVSVHLDLKGEAAFTGAGNCVAIGCACPAGDYADTWHEPEEEIGRAAFVQGMKGQRADYVVYDDAITALDANARALAREQDKAIKEALANPMIDLNTKAGEVTHYTAATWKKMISNTIANIIPGSGPYLFSNSAQFATTRGHQDMYTTKVVQLRKGYVGQVLVTIDHCPFIVAESKIKKTADKAAAAATRIARDRA